MARNNQTRLCLFPDGSHLVAALVEKGASRGKTVRAAYGLHLDQGSLADGLDQLKAALGEMLPASCHLLVCPEQISFRNLKMPFKDLAKIEKILPLELVDHLPWPVPEMVYDVRCCGESGGETDVLAAILGKDYLQELVFATSEAGLVVEQIGIAGEALAYDLALTLAEDDFLLVDFLAHSATLFLVENKKIVLIRSIPFAGKGCGGLCPEIFRTLLSHSPNLLESPGLACYLAGEKDCHEAFARKLAETVAGVKIQSYLLKDQPLFALAKDLAPSYRPEQMDRLVACASEKKAAGFQFAKGEFARPASFAAYLKNAGRFLVPALVLLLMYAGYQFSLFRGLQGEYRQLQQEIAAIFTETVPKERVVNPLQQLKILNKGLQQSFGTGPGGEGSLAMLDILAELSATIPSSYEIRVDRLVADPEIVRIKASTTDFNTVDNVQKELEQSPLFTSVEISSANQSPREDEVRFELRLRLNR